MIDQGKFSTKKKDLNTFLSKILKMGTRQQTF